MAVSKRLRFEVLKRDNHSCRYCGGTAPDVVITIDHVVPVTLGGQDLAENLVAACRDCNAGKSSVPPDAAAVADVAEDAVRWRRAMEIATQGAAAERFERREICDSFLLTWEQWPLWNGNIADIPDDWETSILHFISAGLTIDDIHEATQVAATRRQIHHSQRWRYFCGVCWKMLADRQEIARAILALQEADQS